MSSVNRIVPFFLVPALAFGATPDWPNVEQHAINLLQQYVRLRSVNPPANTTETAKLLQGEFINAGLETKLYESGPGHVNLLVRLPGKDRTKRPLLLLNRMDVVPVDPSRWKQDPFGANIEDGEMWGRGTLDMKSTGVAQLTALILLKQLNIVPPRDILFLSDCDEESDGSNGAGWMIKNHWDELNPEFVLDEGGIGSRDLYTAGKTVFGISVGDKQVLWIKLRASGTSGHASQPIADNANDILLRAMRKSGKSGGTDHVEVENDPFWRSPGELHGESLLLPWSHIEQQDLLLFHGDFAISVIHAAQRITAQNVSGYVLARY